MPKCYLRVLASLSEQHLLLRLFGLISRWTLLLLQTQQHNWPNHTYAETEVLASLPFQVLLFFNLYYSVAYGVALIYLGYIKCTTWAVHDLPRILLIFFILLWCCGEVMRLYFGYYGNLQEKVPHLSAFVLLTFFPAIPSVIYFATLQPLLRPFDQISSIFMLSGLVSLYDNILSVLPHFLFICIYYFRALLFAVKR